MIHVVYTITKKNTAKVHDIITSTDQHWYEDTQVSGGILKSIRSLYPESEFDVEVSTLISTGNQPHE